MKKLILAALVFGLMAAGALAKDMVVSPAALPQTAQTFIQQNFKNANIIYVEQDWDDFEVRLSDGTEIDFHINGDWKEVKAYGTPLPTSILPAPVANAVKKAHPQAVIMKIEKEWNGYEIKLNNMMEMLIMADGTLVGQKLDH